MNKPDMNKQEAIEHIITSTRYWKGDTFDNFSFVNNLGFERAFEAAVEHVKIFHGIKLTEEELEEVKHRLKI